MTTFVTAFIDLKEDRSKDKSYDTFISHFLQLAKTNVHLVVFISSTFLPLVMEKLRSSESKIHFIPIELEELETFKILEGVRELPNNRNEGHDTRNFLLLMNSKVEFVYRAIQKNTFHSETFAWIDFGIAHVFRETEKTMNFLKRLSTVNYNQIMMPGCWPHVNHDKIYDQVQWRFCGGFFIGPRTDLLSFYEKSKEYYQREVVKLTWEVNVWQHLEAEHSISPMWYAADHNDTIIANISF